MNRVQFNALDMFKGVDRVLESNRDIYSGIPMVLQAADSFSAIVNELDVIGSRVETDTSGVTSAKSLAKEGLAKRASALGRAVSAYAHDRIDMVMVSAVDYSYSDIRYAPDQQALQVSMAILGEVESSEEDLAEYGVTAEDVQALKDHIVEYGDLLKIRVEARAEGVAETKKLAFLFRSGNDLLKNKLDSLLYRFRFEQPDFYNAYRNARMIVDLGQYITGIYGGMPCDFLMVGFPREVKYRGDF